MSATAANGPEVPEPAPLLPVSCPLAPGPSSSDRALLGGGEEDIDLVLGGDAGGTDGA